MSLRPFLALAAACVVLSPAVAEAKLVHQTVTYTDGGTTLKGYLVHDDAFKGKRPGVMVVHEWWGLNAYAKQRADELAALGYVAFAADMFGNGSSTDDAEQAKKWAMPFYGNNAGWRTRAKAGFDQLAKRPEVDPNKLGAMGFCFGGSTALELARTGAPVKGVVSFHGGLTTPKPADSVFKGKVLVLHGAADPMVPMKDVQAIQDELIAHHANYQISLFGGAKHAFSNPGADRHHIDGIAYNAQAEKRSIAEMKAFFKEVFGQ